MNAPPPIAAERIPNHLAWAILSTIFSICLCCFVGGIPGIVAIVYAAQVNGKLDRGDVDGARRASDTARTWCWVATGLAIFGLLLNVWGYMTGGTEEYLEMLEQMQQAQQTAV